MLTATIYKRQSTLRQHANGDSNTRQTNSSAEYCTRNNLQVTEVLSDAGISGFTGENFATGELGFFIERVQAGEYQQGHTLVLEHLDRFSRADVDVAINRLTSITTAGVDIAITGLGKEERLLKKGMPLTDMLVVLLEFAQANDESAKKSERLKAAWVTKKQQAKQGVIITKRYPHWLDTKDSKFIIKEANAALVKEMFSLYIKGESFMSIARIFTDRDIDGSLIKSCYPKSTSFKSTNICAILKNHSVYGRLNKMDVDDYYPVIVSKEDFDLVQSIRNKKTTNQHTNNKYTIKSAAKNGVIKHLFSGLYICNTCKASLQYNEGERAKLKTNPNWESLYRLRCMSAQLKSNGRCSDSYTLKARVIEQMLWEQMDNLMLYDAADEINTQQSIKKLDNEIASYDETFNTYNFMIASKYQVPVELENDYNKAFHRVTEINNTKKSLEQQLKNSNKSLLTYKELNSNDKRNQARRLVEHTIKSIKVNWSKKPDAEFLVTLNNLQRYIIVKVEGKYQTVAKGLLLDF